MNKLNNQVLKTINQHNMINSGDTVIVAVSGGADSMALLYCLLCNAKQLNIVVKAAHVNHNLRGTASDGDADFVRSFCQINNIQLYETKLEKTNNPSEEWCRIKRYEFFEKICQCNKNAKIATAHNENDNAETVLMHITRGSGLQGACGIPYVRDIFIRPLLNVNRLQIEEYLKQNNLLHRTDETNKTLDYTRNIVRHKVIPELQGINPKAITSLNRFSETVCQTQDYLRMQGDILLKSAKTENCAKEIGYKAEILAKAHPVILQTALHGIISAHVDASQKLITLCQNAVLSSRGTVQLTDNCFFSAEQGFVCVVSVVNNNLAYNNWQISLEEVLLSENGVKISGGTLKVVLLSCEEIVNFKKAGKNLLNIGLDYGRISNKAIFRTKKEKDYFSSNKRKCTKALKKIYSEAHLSKEKRNENPVLAYENEIIWANGFGISQNAAITEKTKKVLLISFE